MYKPNAKLQIPYTYKTFHGTICTRQECQELLKEIWHIAYVRRDCMTSNEQEYYSNQIEYYEILLKQKNY